jgi:hypothetical protein
VTRKFLDPASPACMASVIDFIAAPEMLSLWMNDPVANVRNGGSPGLAIISVDNPIWEKFARAMVPFMRPLAAKIAARRSDPAGSDESARYCRKSWPVWHQRRASRAGSPRYRR